MSLYNPEPFDWLFKETTAQASIELACHCPYCSFIQLIPYATIKTKNPAFKLEKKEEIFFDCDSCQKTFKITEIRI